MTPENMEAFLTQFTGDLYQILNHQLYENDMKGSNLNNFAFSESIVDSENAKHSRNKFLKFVKAP